MSFKLMDSGQGGNIPVVGYGIGDIAEGILYGTNVDILYLGLIKVLGNAEEQGCAHGTVVDEDPGRGDTHCIHPRHMLCGRFEGSYDPVIVILRILGNLREPYDFLREYGLSVDHCRNLTVGSAGIKADAAAFQVSSHGNGGVFGLRNLFCEHDLKFMLIDMGHEIPVEFTAPPLQ